MLLRWRLFPHIRGFYRYFGVFCYCLRNFRACDYLPWLRLWGGLFAPYAYPTLRPSPVVAGLVGFRCGPHHWLSLRVCVGPFWGGGAVSSFSPPARRGVGYCCASYWCCFCASSCCACRFPRRVLPQVTLKGLSNLSGSSCLSCSCGGALFVGFAVSLVRSLVFYLVPCSSSGACGLRCLPCRWLPLGVSAFSDTVCLAYCCAGGGGWVATLPLCYQCFSCTGCLVGVHWVLHPVSGSSHRGCDCSLDDSVVVLFDSTCL